MLRSVYLRMSDCNEWFVSDNLFRLQLLLFLHYFRISGLYSLAFATLIVEYCKWFVSDNFRISGPHSLAFAAKQRILIVNDLFQIISWPAPHWTRLSSPARPLSGARLAAEVRVEVARLYTVHRQLYCTHVSCTAVHCLAQSFHYCPVHHGWRHREKLHNSKHFVVNQHWHQKFYLANPEYNKPLNIMQRSLIIIMIIIFQLFLTIPQYL